MARTLDDALALQQAGRLDEAESIYRAIVAREPRNADALHLYGGLWLQRGAPEEAIRLIRAALEIDPRNPTFLCNMGTALMEGGEPETAVGQFRQALDTAPDYVDALYNLGNALAATGRHKEAETRYRRAVALKPDHLAAHNNLAISLGQIGETDAAIAALEEALLIDADDSDTHANLAMLLQEKGFLDESIRHHDHALKSRPGDATLLTNRGAAYAIAGRLAEAEADYGAVLAEQPDYVEAWIGIGNLRREEGRLDAAVDCYRAAMDIDPAYLGAFLNLGVVYLADRRLDLAESMLRRANQLAPKNSDAWNNLGQLYNVQGRNADAIKAFGHAISIDPHHIDARFNRGLASLRIGHFADGFHDYRARPSMRVDVGHYHRERFAGGLNKKHIIVVREQGLGDELFFLRFLPALRAQSGGVTYIADPRLVPMLVRAGVADAVLGESDGEAATPPADFRVSVGDLPWLLGVGDNDAPPPTIRLPPLSDREMKMRERLSGFGPPPYVGVTWRAGRGGQSIFSRRRSLDKACPADDLAAVLRPLDARIVILQRQPEEGEVAGFTARLGRDVLDLSAANADLEDMLALVGLLDDQVCVSNTNVHLAAARGRTCRVLLPSPPEFRWMASGDESPWFPGMRLYRQRAAGDWRPAFDALARDLRTGGGRTGETTGNELC